MAKKTDLRVLRTRKLINEAFLKLIEEKGFDAITIQDIANEALINRATFYLHYEDKYALLETMSDTVVEELMALINPAYHVENQEVNLEKFQETIQNVYENVQKNSDFYRVMFGENGVYDFRNSLEEVIRRKFNQNIEILGIQTIEDQIPKELITHFISAAFVGVIQWWLKEDMNFSPQEMAIKLSKVITKGPLKAIGVKVENVND
ncbi:TetR/AcrR family transcriptional regulator [Pseudalkalibacillus decolorationis]|uniref:TetR/AcrR family transcriptional regulator n=1 Tax=Pseudalkalibacillus decolorationis TaxID=163879 RepID=UPI00214816C0|nr:TetR/AcrR family transcriptional regulator [Pseudalkalibacillus decolorationis]